MRRRSLTDAEGAPQNPDENFDATALLDAGDVHLYQLHIPDANVILEADVMDLDY